MSKSPLLNEEIAGTVAAFMANLDPDKAATVSGSFERLGASHIGENARTRDEIAPNFTLPNATGNPVTLYELLNRGPVVLNFYRGGWCPFCSLELRALQAILPEIRALGAQLIGVSPELPDQSLSTQEKLALDFEVLSDAGNKVAGDYGLVMDVDEQMRPLYLEWGFDLPTINGDVSWQLPIPATYVIDSESVIRSAGVDKDYTRRMEPEDILAAVHSL